MYDIMQDLMLIHRYNQWGIWADKPRRVILVRLTGMMSPSEFLQGQDKAFRLMRSFEPDPIHLIYDISEGRVFPERTFKLYKKLALLTAFQFPKIKLYTVSGEDKSPLWYQIMGDDDLRQAIEVKHQGNFKSVPEVYHRCLLPRISPYISLKGETRVITKVKLKS
jgi:hypothetical protein